MARPQHRSLILTFSFYIFHFTFPADGQIPRPTVAAKWLIIAFGAIPTSLPLE
jgi:hypothetical protein